MDYNQRSNTSSKYVWSSKIVVKRLTGYMLLISDRLAKGALQCCPLDGERQEERFQVILTNWKSIIAL